MSIWNYNKIFNIININCIIIRFDIIFTNN